MQALKNNRNPIGLGQPGSAVGFVPAIASKTSSPPTILGIWKLGELLYSGEHSQLFAAQPADAVGSPRFDYVLRTVPSIRETREPSVEQLQRFATAATMVKHPHLVAVLDASVQSAFPYLVMPRLLGNTLSTLIANAKAFPLPVVLWVVRQAAQGVSALHQASWVHGDIKSENLFVDSHCHVTVLDLGFASAVGAVASEVFKGTPKYAAPELICDQPRPITPSADVYALGNLLLELLSWTAPTIKNTGSLEAAAELVADMLGELPESRPSVNEVVSRLLRLEIETLGMHIEPPLTSIRRAA